MYATPRIMPVLSAYGGQTAYADSIALQLKQKTTFLCGGFLNLISG